MEEKASKLSSKLGRFSFLTAAMLFFVTVLTRIPYMTKFLATWDAGTVALGTRHFDIMAHEPHPPGYVLYVLSAKLLNYLFNDINLSLVCISILAAAGAVVLLYFLAREMFNPLTGIIAAVFLMVGKVFWGYSVIAMGYTVLCFFALLVVYLGYKFIKHPEQVKYLYWGSFALAIAGGFRQDLVLFLLPLWLFVTIKYGRRYFWRAWFLFVGVCAVWFLGMVWWTGGFREYFGAFFSTVGYVSGFSLGSRGWDGLIDNYRLFLMFFGDAIKGMSIIIFFAGSFFFPRRLKADVRLALLLFWLVPPGVFYIFVHIGERGYLLSLLPAIIIILAQGLYVFFSELGEVCRWRPWLTYGLLLVVVTMLLFSNAKTFVGTTDYLSAAFLKSEDQALSEKIDLIAATTPGDFYFLERENYKQLHYYLPDHDIYPLPELIPAADIPIIDLTPPK